MRNYTMLVLLGLLAGAATPLAAQWESPTFFAPRPGEDLGLYYVSPTGPADWGIAGIWRQEGNLSLGVRLGLEEGEAFHVGAEFYGPLGLAAGGGLLVDWWLGFGASIADEITWLRVPLGVSLGLNLGSPGTVQLKPYVFPRLAFDLAVFETIGGDEETETEFNVPLDIGVDVDLGAFVLRGGATVELRDTDATTFGAGIALKMPRRIAVR